MNANAGLLRPANFWTHLMDRHLPPPLRKHQQRAYPPQFLFLHPRGERRSVLVERVEQNLFLHLTPSGETFHPWSLVMNELFSWMDAPRHTREFLLLNLSAPVNGQREL